MVKIGLEIHGYIKTKEKLFCRCPANYKEKIDPNKNICPICTGYPGAKPMLPNKEAIKKVIAIGIMLGCKINKELFFQRKHYDWPDLPKGYQNTISGSYSTTNAEKGEFLGIRIKEIHLEEDPAKWDPESGYVDFNRSGLPLVEIVTEPDFTSSKQVRKWLNDFITLMSYINCIEENAGIKCDVNISTTGERVEIKNLNSMYSIEKAIESEISRQSLEKSEGRKIKRETRRYDEKLKTTVLMREKEGAEDYRFIPDPDLPKIIISEKMIKEIESTLPEPPKVKKEKYIRLGIEKSQAEILTRNKDIAEFFESLTVKNKKLAAYWTTIELLRVLNYNNKTLKEVNISPEHFSKLLDLVDSKKITELAAKEILNRFIPKSFNPEQDLRNNLRIDDEKEIESICKEVIKLNEKAVQDYKSGEEKALNFIIGQVMARTKGRADSLITKKLIIKLLK